MSISGVSPETPHKPEEVEVEPTGLAEPPATPMPPPWYRRPLFIVPAVLLVLGLVVALVVVLGGGSGQSVEGVITTPEGPEVGNLVNLKQKGESVATVKTDDEGKFVFDDLAPGKYLFSTSVMLGDVSGGEGVCAFTSNIDVADGSTVELNIDVPESIGPVGVTEDGVWYVCGVRTQ